ncbi:MAG: homocysteine S-methyltransferase family protein [candidate division KSB1 bacterium]|nr:homocysteine S-methyltransferase family protein [candidate division KSB1 bacterium]MDZ7303867.1 homocysteine S-methyltransferase family protein [candidate division KSB1 bacterium]MDZ7313209.1 homocysteine S-methyltransferase family protein [candidate division KSB1 bacterium]
MAMSFLDKLHSGVILLSDGAMGTELQRRGMPTGVCPEEYNLTHPEVVQGIYQDYYAAGSDLVETNTFGANRSRLAVHGFEARVAEFCLKSAHLARAVCPEGKFVAGSMGPTGDLIAPLGPRTLQEIYDIFAEQAVALAEGGVDVIFVETMMAAEEAETAVRAVKEKTHLPVVATMTFEPGKAGLRTMWGVDVPTAVRRLTAVGAEVIGANCGRGFDDMIAIIQQLRPLTDKPIIAQPNAGIPEWVDGVSVYKETPEIILPKAEKLLQLGVNILGGCCGTGPAHIKKMRELLDAFVAKRA